MVKINGTELIEVDNVGGVLARNGKRGRDCLASVKHALSAYFLRAGMSPCEFGEYGRGHYPCGKKRPSGQVVRVKRTQLSRNRK